MALKSTPHTSCKRGKRIIIITISGEKIITKFIERTAKYIVTEAGKFTLPQITSFSIYRG